MTEKKQQTEIEWIVSTFDIEGLAKELGAIISDNITYPEIAEHWKRKGFELPEDIHTFLILIQIVFSKYYKDKLPNNSEKMKEENEND